MIIEAKRLTKKFGTLTAVDSIDLSVREGEIFGLLGPNGAGKTTTISMLSTILQPTSGKAKVAGYDVVRQQDEVRGSIGVVFQDPSLDTELSGYENLDFHAQLYRVPERHAKIREVLELVELWDKRNVLVKNYSGGMKRRLEIARGLMHSPKMLFLDEPTLGLDPQTRRHIWAYIQKMSREQNVSILITTHYMEEADYLCDRVAIVDHGRIIALDKPAKLKSRLGESVLLFGTQDPKALLRLVKKQKCCKKAKVVDGSVQVTAAGGEKIIPMLVTLASRNHVGISSVSMRSPTLEDVFMLLTGRSIREEAPENVFSRRMRS